MPAIIPEDHAKDSIVDFVVNGKLQRVEEWLRAGGNVEECNPSGFPLLFLATQSGQEEMMGLLLRHSASVDAVVHDEMKHVSLLSVAVVEDHAGCARVLLEAGAQPNKVAHDGVPPLVHAAAKGSRDTVNALLEARADANVQVATPDDLGAGLFTPLMAAVMSPDYEDESAKLEVVRNLLGSRADASVVGPGGKTASLLALQMGPRMAIIAELIRGDELKYEARRRGQATLERKAKEKAAKGVLKQSSYTFADGEGCFAPEHLKPENYDPQVPADKQWMASLWADAHKKRAAGDAAGAIRCYQALIDSASADPLHLAQCHLNMGEIYAAMGNEKLGLVSFRKAVELEPCLASAHCNIGAALSNNGDYSGALECFDKCLAQDPDNTLALTNRGITLAHIGRDDEALADLHRARALDLRDIDAEGAKDTSGKVSTRAEVSDVIAHIEAKNAGQDVALLGVTWAKLYQGCGACGAGCDLVGEAAAKKLKVCSRCGEIGFCNAECLKRAWRSHKKCCGRPLPSPSEVHAMSFAAKLATLEEYGPAHAGLALFCLEELSKKFHAESDDLWDPQTARTNADELRAAVPVITKLLACFTAHAVIKKRCMMLKGLMQDELQRHEGGEVSEGTMVAKLHEVIDVMGVDELKPIIAARGLGFDDCKTVSDFRARAKEGVEQAKAKAHVREEESVSKAEAEASDDEAPPSPQGAPHMHEGTCATPARPLGTPPQCELWLPLPCAQCAAPLTDANGVPGSITYCCGQNICEDCVQRVALRVFKNKLKACQFCHAKPHPSKMSSRQTIAALTALAERGSAHAQETLACKYRDGENGLREDPMEAARLLQQAVDQGSTAACVRLADLLLGCGADDASFAIAGYQGVPLDDVSGVRLMALAAEAGHPLAQYNIGFMLSRGTNGLPEDEMAALPWKALAAQGGNEKAKLEGAVYVSMLISEKKLGKLATLCDVQALGGLMRDLMAKKARRMQMLQIVGDRLPTLLRETKPSARQVMQMMKTPTPTKPIEEMSNKELKEHIKTKGLNTRGCLDKADLIARAKEEA